MRGKVGGSDGGCGSHFWLCCSVELDSTERERERDTGVYISRGVRMVAGPLCI